jgi:hypothetical protein
MSLNIPVFGSPTDPSFAGKRTAQEDFPHFDNSGGKKNGAAFWPPRRKINNFYF